MHFTHAESFQVIERDSVAEEMKQRILEHASMTVPKRERRQLQPSILTLCTTHERTNLSRLSHFGFLGLKVMNLLNRTCAAGAKPMGAPGWPELALDVASTLKPRSVPRHYHARQWQGTHGQDSDGVDGKLIILGITHDWQLLLHDF